MSDNVMNTMATGALAPNRGHEVRPTVTPAPLNTPYTNANAMTGTLQNNTRAPRITHDDINNANIIRQRITHEDALTTAAYYPGVVYPNIDPQAVDPIGYYTTTGTTVNRHELADMVARPDRMNEVNTAYTSILTALAYLLYKKGILSAGEYQILSDVDNKDFYAVVAQVLAVADDK